MNPETNRFEELTETTDQLTNLEEKFTDQCNGLVRPNGRPVPQHWIKFALEEIVVIKEYSFRVKYIGETAILFEPVGPVVIGEQPR